MIGSLIVLLSLVTLVGERGALHLWRLRGEKTRLDEQNYRLQKEKRIFTAAASMRIRNDDDYLEKLAREELNMAPARRIVYRFPKPGSRDAARREANEPASQSRPAAAQKAPRSGPR